MVPERGQKALLPRTIPTVMLMISGGANKSTREMLVLFVISLVCGMLAVVTNVVSQQVMANGCGRIYTHQLIPSDIDLYRSISKIRGLN